MLQYRLYMQADQSFFKMYMPTKKYVLHSKHNEQENATNSVCLLGT